MSNTTIQDSKNVVAGNNTIIVSGDFHLGDKNIKDPDLQKILDRIEELQLDLTEIINEKTRARKQKALDEALQKKKDYLKGVKKILEDNLTTDHNTERLKQVKKYMDTGKIGDARALLIDEQLKSEQEEVMQEKQLQRKFINKAKSNAQCFLYKAQLEAIAFNNPNRIEDAINTFKDSIKSYSFFKNNFLFAKFLFEHNLQLDLAESHYKEALRDRDITKEEAADVQLLLAELYQSKEERQRAEFYFDESIQIREKILDPSKVATIYKLALTLNAKGRYFQQFEDYETAEAIFLQAESLLQSVKESSNNILELNSSINNNLGIVLWQKAGDRLSSIQRLEKSLKLFRSVKFAESHQQEAQYREASILSNIASYYTELEQLGKAKTYYTDSLEKYKTLAKENPYRYEKELGKEHINLSIFYLKQKEKTLSNQHITAGVSLLKKYMMDLPELANYFELGKQIEQELQKL